MPCALLPLLICYSIDFFKCIFRDLPCKSEFKAAFAIVKKVQLKFSTRNSFLLLFDMARSRWNLIKMYRTIWLSSLRKIFEQILMRECERSEVYYVNIVDVMQWQLKWNFSLATWKTSNDSWLKIFNILRKKITLLCKQIYCSIEECHRGKWKMSPECSGLKLKSYKWLQGFNIIAARTAAGMSLFNDPLWCFNTKSRQWGIC